MVREVCGGQSLISIRQRGEGKGWVKQGNTKAAGEKSQHLMKSNLERLRRGHHEIFRQHPHVVDGFDGAARSLQAVAHDERQGIRVTRQHGFPLRNDKSTCKVERRGAVDGQQEQVPDVEHY